MSWLTASSRQAAGRARIFGTGQLMYWAIHFLIPVKNICQKSFWQIFLTGRLEDEIGLCLAPACQVIGQRCIDCMGWTGLYLRRRKITCIISVSRKIDFFQNNGPYKGLKYNCTLKISSQPNDVSNQNLPTYIIPSYSDVTWESYCLKLHETLLFVPQIYRLTTTRTLKLRIIGPI